MKKFLAAFFFIGTFNSSIAQNWDYVGGSISSGVSGLYLRMELTADGKPIIAYRDGNANNKLTVKKHNPNNSLGEWDSLGTAGFTQGTANFISLALGQNSVPYISYSDGAQSNKITVVTYNGTTWQNVGAPGFSTDGVVFNEIAIAPNGTPFVAYCGSNNDKLTVKKYDGTAWQDVGTPKFSDGEASYINLKFDGNGTPYVAYRDAGNGSKLTVMKHDGTAWVNVGAPGFSSQMAGYVSFAISANGTPYIAYTSSDNASTYEMSSGGIVTVKKFDGNSWTDVGTPGFSDGAVRYINLALNASGTPYIAFEDRFTGDYKGTVMKYNGTGWENVGGARFTQSVLKFSNLRFDASGNLLFGYIAKPTVGPRSVIIRKSLIGNGGNVGIEVYGSDDLNIFPNPASDIINITTKAGSKNGILHVYGIDGKTMTSEQINANQYGLDISTWPQGVYWFTVDVNGRNITKKIVKQ